MRFFTYIIYNSKLLAPQSGALSRLAFRDFQSHPNHITSHRSDRLNLFCIKVDTLGWKWMEVNESGWKWMKISAVLHTSLMLFCANNALAHLRIAWMLVHQQEVDNIPLVLARFIKWYSRIKRAICGQFVDNLAPQCKSGQYGTADNLAP